MNASQQKFSDGLNLLLHLTIDCKKTFDFPQERAMILEVYNSIYIRVSRHRMTS